MLFGCLVIGNLQLVIGNRQLAIGHWQKRQLVIGQTKVTVLLDRVDFLDRLECLDRPEYLNRLDCHDRSGWIGVS